MSKVIKYWSCPKNSPTNKRLEGPIHESINDDSKLEPFHASLTSTNQKEVFRNVLMPSSLEEEIPGIKSFALGHRAYFLFVDS